MRNYKSIASCDVAFPPLLILLGPNGAGKSNFIDALMFVRDALESTPADALARREGLDEVLRRVPERAEELHIGLEFQIELGRRARVEYDFTLGRDSNQRVPVVVKRERCLISRADNGEKLAGFEVDSGRIAGGGRVEPDRLFLPLAAMKRDYSEVYHSLRNMLFHHVDSDEMRRIDPDRRTRTLGYSGRNLGAVLGELAARYPAIKNRLDDYLKAIVPTVRSIDQRVVDGHSMIELHTLDGDRPFPAAAISEGTLHAAGVLAALFQPIAIDGEAALVAIEEPETALHPAAAGVLFDALTEASERVQVVVTTQSADLLDRDDLDPASLRVASISDGVTVIGEIDEISFRLIKDKRSTVGELMRGDQLRPWAGS